MHTLTWNTVLFYLYFLATAQQLVFEFTPWFVLMIQAYLSVCTQMSFRRCNSHYINFLQRCISSIFTVIRCTVGFIVPPDGNGLCVPANVVVGLFWGTLLDCVWPRVWVKMNLIMTHRSQEEHGGEEMRSWGLLVTWQHTSLHSVKKVWDK